jgi:hypothetical protein
MLLLIPLALRPEGRNLMTSTVDANNWLTEHSKPGDVYHLYDCESGDRIGTYVVTVNGIRWISAQGDMVIVS